MEIVDAFVPVAIGFVLALIGIVLLWRGVIQPDALAKMESMTASTEARLDRMRQRYDELQAELDEVRASLVIGREEMAEMRVEMAEWRAGMQLVFAQLRAVNIVPAWLPPDKPAGRPSKRTRAALAARIAQQFNREEIDNLAYELGIVPEDIAGATTAAHARELTDLAWRRGLSEALAKRVNELRGGE